MTANPNLPANLPANLTADLTADANRPAPAQHPGAPPHPEPAEATRDHVNALLNAAMSYAGQLLKREGEFPPFAVTLDVHDRLDIDSATRSEDAVAQLDALRAELLRRTLPTPHQTSAAQVPVALTAAALAVNVEARQQVPGGFQDAVRLEIQHQDGYCAAILIPYKLSGGALGGLLPRRLHFGPSMTRALAPWIWPGPPSDQPGKDL